MTSPQRVRYLLTNRRIILGNLVRAAQTMMTDETEREIIEALVLAAAAYFRGGICMKMLGVRVYLKATRAKEAKP